MRKITLFNRISLDGFYAGPGGGIDWFVQDSDLDKYVMGSGSPEPGAVLFGRITYQMFEDVWPNVARDPNAPAEAKQMADSLNRMTKVVFSNTLKELNWENSMLLKGDVAEQVRKIKQAGGGDIIIFGSGTIVRPLASEGLIDEYLLIVTPVILGTGKLMFEDVKRSNLKLVEAKDFPSGNVLLSYRMTTAF
jgi:dihydrofolate reductase